MPFSIGMQQSSPGFDLAIIAATISILIGGILFGVGLGFGIRRIRLLGAEEIGQGIISAAMVGCLISFALLLDSTTASLVPSALPSCPSIQNPSSSPYSYYACNLESLQSSLLNLASSISRAGDIAGFASSLRLSVGVISAQPFFALESASQGLYGASFQAHSLASLAFFEAQLALFIQISALAVLLPAGLLLRTFFATRRLGAAAMALAISAYFVYPLFFLYTFSISQAGAAASQALAQTVAFNQEFASVPLLDLDDTSSVRDTIDAMSQGDFGSKIQPLFPLSSQAMALAALDLILYPLVSLIVSAVAALEFYRLLSAPIFLPYFDSI